MIAIFFFILISTQIIAGAKVISNDTNDTIVISNSTIAPAIPSFPTIKTCVNMTFEDYIKCNNTFKTYLDLNITNEIASINKWYFNYIPHFVNFSAEPFIDEKTSYMCIYYNEKIANIYNYGNSIHF